MWNHDQRIVISDIDGTVTKSDVLGHLLPRVSRHDWSHSGIASFYSGIKRNGYDIVYLSSRPVGLMSSTKDHMRRINQDDGSHSGFWHIAYTRCHMPEGPFLLSPDGTAKVLVRELITKQAHLYKINTLEIIRDLFPKES